MTPEEKRANNKVACAKYYQAHKAQIKAKNSCWRSRNPERVRVNIRRYRELHPEQARNRVARYRRKYPAKVKMFFRRWCLRTKYGLTLAQFDTLAANQSGLCAICREPLANNRRGAVDHDHFSGKVRGLLCGECNRGLGNFRDNPVLLLMAVRYLRKFYQI